MLKQRVVTGVILLFVATSVVLFAPDRIFSLITAGLLTLGAWEWAYISGFSRQWQRLAYAGLSALALWRLSMVGVTFLLGASIVWWLVAWMLLVSYPDSRTVWRHPATRLVIGWMVLMPAWAGLDFLKKQEGGNLLVLQLFVMVWGADIGAYFAGKKWGRRKLAPQVSPGKTWEGVWGGLTLVTVLSLILGWHRQLAALPMLELLLQGWLICLFSVLGDLFESVFKREQGIKDSGQLLPGHGGLMDRMDGLVAATPLFAVFCLL